MVSCRVSVTKREGGPAVIISYNKLWKMLIDKKMNKRDLKRVSGVSTASIAKLSKGDNITTDVLLKICKALNCDIIDIMEIEREPISEADISMVQPTSIRPGMRETHNGSAVGGEN